MRQQPSITPNGCVGKRVKRGRADCHVRVQRSAYPHSSTWFDSAFYRSLLYEFCLLPNLLPEPTPTTPSSRQYPCSYIDPLPLSWLCEFCEASEPSRLTLSNNMQSRQAKVPIVLAANEVHTLRSPETKPHMYVSMMSRGVSAVACRFKQSIAP